MKMFFVFNEIFECSPLMIGGKESTTLSASRMTGYTGELEMIGRYGLKY
jgi:hypothetical protein